MLATPVPLGGEGGVGGSARVRGRTAWQVPRVHPRSSILRTFLVVPSCSGQGSEREGEPWREGGPGGHDQTAKA